MELLVAIIIVTILTKAALPGYGRMVEKSRMRDAEAKLNIIYQAERIYDLDNNIYATRAQLIPAYSPEPNTPDFTFTITSTDFNTGYTATATRNGSGKYGGSTISLTQAFSGTYTYSGEYNANGLPN
ncbi:MAG: hypothetical protein NC910_02080 [Candidatus Omnitrophica bacterium]|nr:hypothetical protein [Candidatus Omnitrophota bacterium]